MYAELIWLLGAVADEVPDAEDVVAGWTAFALFGLGILAVALLGFSLTKRLKNVDRAEELGLYAPSDKKKSSGVGDRPAPGESADPRA